MLGHYTTPPVHPSIPIASPCCQRMYPSLESEALASQPWRLQRVSAKFINFINFIKFIKFELERGRAAGWPERRRTLPALVAAGATWNPVF